MNAEREKAPGEGGGAALPTGEAIVEAALLHQERVQVTLPPDDVSVLQALIAERRGGAIVPEKGVAGAVPKDEVARLLKLSRLLLDVVGMKLHGNAVTMPDGSFYDDVMVVQAKKELERAERLYGVVPERIEFTTTAVDDDGPPRAAIHGGDFDDDDGEGRRGIFR